MRLQIWRKTLNRDRVGLIFLFFMPALWQVQMVKPTLFPIFCGMAVHLTLNAACLANGRLSRMGRLRLLVTLNSSDLPGFRQQQHDSADERDCSEDRRDEVAVGGLNVQAEEIDRLPRGGEGDARVSEHHDA